MDCSNQTSPGSRRLTLLALGLIGLAIPLIFLRYCQTESASPLPERRGALKKSKPHGPVPLGPDHRLVQEVDRSPMKGQGFEIENLRRELASAKVELARLSKPLHEDILSSTVNAEIREGETLVTGGYMTANGNHELTLLTPRSVVLEDGRKVIEVEAHVLSVGAEFTKAHGLDKLVTNARNTLQHAEAWTKPGTDETLAAATAAGGEEAELVTFPNVRTAASQPFKISTGEYSFEGTFSRNPDGGFSIKSHIERSSQAEPDADGNPH